MKTGSCVCPVCFRETLTEVVSRIGTYWRCLNRNCGKTFLPEALYSTGSDDVISDDVISYATVGVSEDQLEMSRRFRIPTTEVGQVYELRRIFRL